MEKTIEEIGRKAWNDAYNQDLGQEIANTAEHYAEWGAEQQKEIDDEDKKILELLSHSRGEALVESLHQIERLKQEKQAIVDKAVDWLDHTINQDLSIGDYTDTIQSLEDDLRRTLEDKQ